MRSWRARTPRLLGGPIHPPLHRIDIHKRERLRARQQRCVRREQQCAAPTRLPPTHAGTGADHEVLPLRRPSATLLLGAWRDLLALPSRAAPDVGHGVANRDEPAVQDLERGHRHRHRSVNGTGSDHLPQILMWPRPTEPRHVDDALPNMAAPEANPSAVPRVGGRPCDVTRTPAYLRFTGMGYDVVVWVVVGDELLVGDAVSVCCPEAGWRLDAGAFEIRGSQVPTKR